MARTSATQPGSSKRATAALRPAANTPDADQALHGRNAASGGSAAGNRRAGQGVGRLRGHGAVGGADAPARPGSRETAVADDLRTFITEAAALIAELRRLIRWGLGILKRGQPEAEAIIQIEDALMEQVALEHALQTGNIPQARASNRECRRLLASALQAIRGAQILG
jgi:hypothetical protein